LADRVSLAGPAYSCVSTQPGPAWPVYQEQGRRGVVQKLSSSAAMAAMAKDAYFNASIHRPPPGLLALHFAF
jgi:hypothetical protein